MANGTGSDEFVVLSTVRPGLKRELAFVLKAQSEIWGGALGRTRSRKASSDSPSSAVSSSIRSKRLRRGSNTSREDKGDSEGLAAGKVVETEDESVRVVDGARDLISEEEAKSDVVDLEEDTINVDSGRVETGHSCEEKSGGIDNVIEKERDFAKSLVEEEDHSKEIVSWEKPSRRFTRSLLKQKEEEVEKSVPRRKAKSAPSKPSVNGEDDNKHGDPVSSSGMIATNLEMKMSKKIGLRHPFVALKDFLETGLLEGFPVKYCRGARPGRSGLGGVINGNGILCSCNQCKGAQVVSPTIFEMHAGGSNKRLPEYIFLENGRSLRDVMNAVKDSPLETLEEAVLAVLGTSSLNKCTICVNCKEALEQAEGGKTALICKMCLEMGEPNATPCQVPDATGLLNEVPDATSLLEEVPDVADQMKEPDTSDQSIEVPATAAPSRKKRGAIERSPEPGLVRKSSASSSKCSSSQIKSHGRLTRKDLRLHKLVFEDDVLPDGTEVSYYIQGKKMLVG